MVEPSPHHPKSRVQFNSLFEQKFKLNLSFMYDQIYNSQFNKSGHTVLLLTSNLNAQQTASENKGSCLALPLGVTKFILFRWPCSWSWDELLQTPKLFLKKKKNQNMKNPVCLKLHSLVEYLQIKPLTSDGKIPLVIIAKLFSSSLTLRQKKLERLSPTTSSFRLV